jgi:hypothetical protein
LKQRPGPSRVERLVVCFEAAIQAQQVGDAQAALVEFFSGIMVPNGSGASDRREPAAQPNRCTNARNPCDPR